MAKPLFHHRRKLSNAGSTGGGNGLSFSGKDAYDDVFSGGLKPKFGAGAAAASAPSFGSRRVAAEDYAEIFGGKNGTRGSSIPVLDLTDLDDGNGSDDLRSSGRKMDYSMIFGCGDDVPSAVPAYEELFSGVKKAKRNEAKARIPAGTGSPLKGSDCFNSSENIKSHACETRDQILDSGKQFNMSYHKTGARRKDVLNGTTHIAQLNAVPGFSYVIDESARRETQQDKAMPSVQSEVNHSRSSSDRLIKAEQDKAMPPVKVEVNNRSPSNDVSDAKYGRRPKWQVPTTNAFEGSVKHKIECNKDANYSRDKLLNAKDAGLKSHLSKDSSPSSSSAHLKDSMGQPKRSKFSSFGSKAEASEVVSGYATPFSDEELDVNSAAAASVEALKKAIEQAQESIRIAKEKMERKSRSRYSLKATGGSEINYAQEANNTRENNVKETRKRPESEVQDSTEFHQEVALGSGGFVSGFTQKEGPATGRQTVAELNCENVEVAETVAELNCENVEVAEDSGVALWFTQLLNNGKQKMAALASELVVKKNSILQPMDKNTDNVQEIKPAKMTLECDTTENVNSVDRVLQFGNTDTKLNVLGRSVELRKNMDDSDSSQCANEDRPTETLKFAQKDEVTKNRQHDLDKEEGGEVNLAYCHETFSDVQFELHKLETVLPENNLLKVEGKSFEQEVGSELEHFSVGDENDGRVDEVENKNKEGEYDLGVDKEDLALGNEDDEPKLATDYMSDGKRQGDDIEEWSEGYDKQESDARRFAESVEGEENQTFSKEEKVQEGIDREPAGPHENEEAGSMDDDDDYSSLYRKIEVNDELQESEGNPRENLYEAVYEPNFDADNACGSVNLVDFQDTCKSALENISELTSRLGIRNLEEKGALAGFTEESSQQENRKIEGVAGNVEVNEYLQELDGDAKAGQSVEGASCLAGAHILETSSMDHVNVEENIMESVMQDISDTTASGPTGSTATFDFINMVHESEQSKDLGIDGFSNNDIDQDIMEDEYATEASAVNNPSNSDFNDLNGHTQIHENDRKFACSTENLDGSVHEEYGQNHIEESDRESESSMHPECGNGFVREFGGSAENGNVEGTAGEDKIEKDNHESCQKEQVCNEKESESSHFSGEEDMETNSDGKTDQSSENSEENGSRTFLKEMKETKETSKEEMEKDDVGTSEVKKRDRERERDRMAVDRAIREARERAFAEARERAERAAVEKATTEVRQRAMAEAREKLDNLSSVPKVSVDKASIAAKLRAERAAVERATAEARERALEKALSQKTISETRTQSERDASGKFSAASREGGIKHSFSSSDLENFGSSSESAQRRKARLERHQRIMERAAKALAEKNLRDVLAQREQAQKNRLAETLDAEIKRWASGKEGNLRALLSTLQYILGPGSGWQPISLTEIVTTAAVKKAYRKATLYVHPDKLQQRGASIQQKYICEKVFDLLKAAWNKFNSEER